ncbi:hypothetical protein SAY87_025778 [Trapa incisa]|uniref:Uncharacterized protein n=1 Tax=Trapa incisa TaxID=236973 RepID=A0AAN7GIB7_9MYRT|nr:hypothetical protein SAY87_025778 [Trapa incisa]
MFCLKPKGVAHSLFQEAPTLILCGYSGLERWEILVHTSHKSHRTRSKHAGRISCKQSTETGLLLPFVGGLVQTVSSAFVKPVKQLKKPEAIFSLVRLYSTGLHFSALSKKGKNNLGFSAIQRNNFRSIPIC